MPSEVYITKNSFYGLLCRGSFGFCLNSSHTFLRSPFHCWKTNCYKVHFKKARQKPAISKPPLSILYLLSVLLATSIKHLNEDIEHELIIFFPHNRSIGAIVNKRNDIKFKANMARYNSHACKIQYLDSKTSFTE